jgi:hypothetical protein
MAINPYFEVRKRQPMPKTSDNVTWPQLLGLVGLAVVVVGGAFAWLHNDIGDIKIDVREIRMSANDVAKQAALTNQKLDILIKK